MSRHIMRRLTLLMFGLTLLVGPAAITQASAPNVFKVTHILVVASPKHYTGACPAVITFTARITVNGPGTITYEWFRSDGATSASATLTFTAAGTQSVTTTWTLGGATLHSYNGWEAVKVLTPKTKPSSHATFTMQCQ